jgi:hypothetical protein
VQGGENEQGTIKNRGFFDGIENKRINGKGKASTTALSRLIEGK